MKNLENVAVLKDIFAKATAVAKSAASQYFIEKWNAVDGGCCGFAWVTITGVGGKKIRANSKLGKALAAIGVKRDWQNFPHVWNPADMMCQNIDTKEAGAEAFAKVLRDYGFDAYAGSRMD